MAFPGPFTDPYLALIVEQQAAADRNARFKKEEADAQAFRLDFAGRRNSSETGGGPTRAAYVPTQGYSAYVAAGAAQAALQDQGSLLIRRVKYVYQAVNTTSATSLFAVSSYGDAAVTAPAANTGDY